MKKIFSGVCAAALSLALLAAPVQAAADIRVELDGTPLTFTDAAPLAQNGRTYLPFRAIFEAMGAEVGWDAASQTVSAVRDGRTVTLTPGETDIRITEDGVSTTLATDAAPFARDGRTYVPVRFAAEAFDAAVGWEQSTRTVHIADTAALLDRYDGSFALLQKMLDTAALAYPAAPQRVSGRFTLSSVTQTAMGSLPVTMSGTFSGDADRISAAYTGTCATDTEALRNAITANEGEVIDSRIEALLRRFEKFTFGTVLNYSTGTRYLRSENLGEFGLSGAGGWVSDALPAYGAPLPTDARDFVRAQAAKADPADVTAVFDALSDASAAGNTLTVNGTTLTLSGKNLTVETVFADGTARVETLSKNRRSCVLMRGTADRTETLTCSITLRAGGETPERTPL